LNFTRRVSRLERRMGPKRVPRVVLRFEGPGTEQLSERFAQPEEEIDENALVIVVRSVPTPAWTMDEEGRLQRIDYPEQASDPQMRADEGR
jgi:hypothetical protein